MALRDLNNIGENVSDLATVGDTIQTVDNAVDSAVNTAENVINDTKDFVTTATGFTPDDDKLMSTVTTTGAGFNPDDDTPMSTATTTEDNKVDTTKAKPEEMESEGFGFFPREAKGAVLYAVVAAILYAAYTSFS
jgi:hypothetical protein